MKYGIKLKAYLKKINKEPLYDNKYINTKIKIYIDEYYAYLSTILLDSISVNLNNEYYLQIFFKKCLYAINMKALNTSFYDISFDNSIDESSN